MKALHLVKCLAPYRDELLEHIVIGRRRALFEVLGDVVEGFLRIEVVAVLSYAYEV